VNTFLDRQEAARPAAAGGAQEPARPLTET
jgi:hypothetical protein